MKQLREVARLRYDLGCSYAEIAGSVGVARSTVQEALRRLRAVGFSWPLPAELDEDALYAQLYPTRPVCHAVEPDFAALSKELARKGVTRKLLWRECAEQHPGQVWGYAQFCARWAAFEQRRDPAMRMTHKPGARMFVDYAGMTLPVTDRYTGVQTPAQIFVAALGYSHAIYAEATASQKAVDWIGSNTRALAYYGGVVEAVVPDNLKAAVVTPDRYEPRLQDDYREWAQYYGTAILPARVRAPDDKAKVENAVRLVEQDILAPLRDRTFFALAELNAAIRPGVTALNAKPFTKREGSRASALAEERTYLKPLPARPYSYGQWKRAKVHLDYHVEIGKRFYSVPYTLIGQTVDVRIGAETLEIYHKGQRVAAHPLGYKPGDFVTQPAHMPEAHRQYRDRTQGRLQQRAAEVGPGTAAIIARQVTRKVHPEQTYRSSLGILRLARDFSPARLEAACQRALELEILSYRGIRDLLTQGVGEPVNPKTLPVLHANVRGPAYFGDAHAH
ncbi:MAG: IS21 family transposase [Rhodanobacteraceae bacterium]